MTLALLVLYAGVVLLVLVLATAWWWQAVERKEILRMALRSGGLLVAVVACYAAYGWFDGSLSYWIETLDIEYVNDYLASAPRWISGPLFAGYFVLGCGGVTVLGLLWAFRRTAWQRTVATTTLLYLLIVLCSGFKNLHYLGPLLPIPVILYLMPAAGREMFVPWKKCAVATGSLIACIVLCWPAARPAFTLNRQLGEQTTIAADDYLTAARWARLRYTMKENGTMSWDCDQHTWVTYSQLDGLKHPRPLVLTGGGPPAPAYRLIASQRLEQTDVVVRLYARDERWVKWLATRRPLRPLERYPAVFRPLADGVFSPHNNTLEDVPRLRWPW